MRDVGGFAIPCRECSGETRGHHDPVGAAPRVKHVALVVLSRGRREETRGPHDPIDAGSPGKHVALVIPFRGRRKETRGPRHPISRPPRGNTWPTRSHRRRLTRETRRAPDALSRPSWGKRMAAAIPSRDTQWLMREDGMADTFTPKRRSRATRPNRRTTCSSTRNRRSSIRRSSGTNAIPGSSRTKGCSARCPMPREELP
jgi:hypothetical protein